MKKSTKRASITILAIVLLLSGIGAAFGNTNASRPAWTPASFYAAAAQGGSTNSLYA